MAKSVTRIFGAPPAHPASPPNHRWYPVNHGGMIGSLIAVLSRALGRWSAGVMVLCEVGAMRRASIWRPDPPVSRDGNSVAQALASLVHSNSVPSRQIAIRITAILRAVATAAFLKPFRPASRPSRSLAQDFKSEKRLT